MIFSPPLPWNSQTVKELQDSLAETENLHLKWWWEPFHKPGLRALKFAVQKKIPPQELQTILENLSCPGAGRDLVLRHQLKNLVNENGALLPLDPQYFIKMTWDEAGNNLEAFTSPEVFLPTIGQLKNILNPAHWTPVLLNPPAEFHTLSNWLTASPSILKRFQALDPWTQLECMESLIGVTKSQTNLHFQRIYSL